MGEQHFDQGSGSPELPPAFVDDVEASFDVIVVVVVDVLAAVIGSISPAPVVRICDASLELVEKPEVGDDPFALDRGEGEAGGRGLSGESLDSIQTSGGGLRVGVEELKRICVVFYI